MALSSTPRPEATSGLLRDPSSRGRPSAAAPVSRLSLRDGSRHLYRKHGSSQSTGKALGGRERRQVWPPSVSTGAKPEPGAVQISDTRAVYVSPAQPASDRERPQAADESADELASASASGPENVGEPRPAAASAVREQLEAVENQPQEPGAAPGSQPQGLFPSLQFGFTRQNELLVGRVAMLGFGASLIGEAITGKGTLAQLDMETGIPIYDAEPLLLFFILFSLVGAVRGLDKTGMAMFRNDGQKTQLWARLKSKTLRGFLGLPETGPLFAFSTPNELFVGRMAQLGFAFALIGETVSGKGALAQLKFETGIPVSELEPLLILSIAFFFLSTINPETGKFFQNRDQEE